jgi:phosphatidylserine/phosphatidylglycerophosphate/cardiolipin synthase-like enzyme
MADRRTPCAQQEGVSALAAAGVPVWIDDHAGISYENALIIDRHVTIMGSYNFSADAALDNEDLNVVIPRKWLTRMRDTGRCGRRHRFR